jgi:alpha-D-ribose 1-methylphosphonate 5-triphosphate diphosphatase
MLPDSVLLANARVVLADCVLESGWVAVENGIITGIGSGTAPGKSEDLAGDLLIPGLVELHTDNLEAHVAPRPGVRWDTLASVVAYDAQLATCGITTVLDSLRVWREEGDQEEGGEAAHFADTIHDARMSDILRADHYLHLRCEVPMPYVVSEAESLIGRPEVRLVSLMDHTPGQRQFRDEKKLREYYLGKSRAATDAELDALFEIRRQHSQTYGEKNYRDLVALAHRHGRPLASHDDTSEEHAAQAVNDGVAIAEFPTTLEAARHLHAAGVKVMMGAPNLVRGASHSGNVATEELAREGLLDVLSSDYVPASLLLAAFALPQRVPGISLPRALATVTKTPAEAVGLADRGEIAAGKRGDLVRVRRSRGMPVTIAVWRQGRRVA